MHSLFIPLGRHARFSIARTILWLGLLIYSLQFYTFDINTAVMDAWIHLPYLIFHEAGHVIFMPFGQFMTILWLGLLIYSLQFYTFDINTAVMDAWIHLPNLIFHEAGHVIFMPFGQFMTILGGSLMQVIVPSVIIYVFLLREHDPYAASIGLWWLGQNLTDVALYISDASARLLPLIGGMSEEAHDWGNLLTMTGLLEYDHTFGLIAHYVGLILMTLALWWGLRILVYTYVHRAETRDMI